MPITTPKRVRFAPALASLAVGALLASCGGGNEGGAAAAPLGSSQPWTPLPAPPPPFTGSLTVTVLDMAGKPLRNATFNYACGTGNTVCEKDATDPQGIYTLTDVRAGHQVHVSNALGSVSIAVEIDAARPAFATATIKPFLEPTAAILAASVPVESVSADRSELDLHLTVAVSGAWDAFSQVGGSMRWLVGAAIAVCPGASPDPGQRCVEGDGEDVGYRQIAPFDPATEPSWRLMDHLPSPLTTPPREPYSALLLVDQGRRIQDADRAGFRPYAAQNFLLRSRATDKVALAGFAGSDGDASRPALLPQLPVWLPPGMTPNFSTDHAGWARVVDELAPQLGGSSPLYDALEAAMDLVAAQVPLPQRRALVVFTGGDDDSLLAPQQREARWESLRRKRLDTGVEVVLVAGHIDSRTSPQRRALTELSASGFASLIMMTTHDDNRTGYYDDLYSSLDLAADLLAGVAPTYELVFRLKTSEPGGFRQGSRLHGDLVLTDDCAPGWWYCYRGKPFVARIPP